VGFNLEVDSHGHKTVITGGGGERGLKSQLLETQKGVRKGKERKKEIAGSKKGRQLPRTVSWVLRD